jgi:hypothetical protein
MRLLHLGHSTIILQNVAWARIQKNATEDDVKLIIGFVNRDVWTISRKEDPDDFHLATICFGIDQY